MKIDPERLKTVELVAQSPQIVVVNKPGGLAVHGGAGQTGRTLIDILKEASTEPDALFPVHRLDRATSGIVIFAKSKDAARQLAKQWPAIKKEYVALVFGEWQGPELVEQDVSGKPATTRILGHRHFKGELPLSILRLQLETGRTHQIRQHLSSLGNQIVMDDKYGNFRSNKEFRQILKAKGVVISKKNLFLHAVSLKLPDQEVHWQAAPPKIWHQAMQALGNFDANLWPGPNVV